MALKIFLDGATIKRLHACIAHRVLCRQYQHLEHRHRIVGWSAASGPVFRKPTPSPAPGGTLRSSQPDPSSPADRLNPTTASVDPIARTIPTDASAASLSGQLNQFVVIMPGLMGGVPRVTPVRTSFKHSPMVDFPDPTCKFHCSSSEFPCSSARELIIRRPENRGFSERVRPRLYRISKFSL